ncbi:lactonase family protein [Amaricoccus solimangrovi]|nr:beta-propeller fold lactonase family protein [Amaricoccus solimangrovi]
MSAERLYAYVAHGPRDLSVWAMSGTGDFSKLQELPINDRDLAPGTPIGRFAALCVSPDRRFLFASDRAAPYGIRSWAIDREKGTLTYLGDSPAADSSPYIITDPPGNFLLAAHNPVDPDRRTGFVSVAAIREGFVQAPHQVIRTPPKTHAIQVDASGRFVLLPCCDADVVVRLRFDCRTGLLDSDTLSPLVTRPGAGPRHCVFHPGNRFAYVNNEYDGTIYAYSFDPRDGAMSEIQVVQTRPASAGPDENVRVGDLRISPNGKFLFTTVRSGSTVVGFAVDPRTGLLTSIGQTQVDGEARSLAFDPLGRFLVVNGRLTHTAHTYRLDGETGALDKVSAFRAPDHPGWIELVNLS